MKPAGLFPDLQPVDDPPMEDRYYKTTGSASVRYWRVRNGLVTLITFAGNETGSISSRNDLERSVGKGDLLKVTVREDSE